MTKLTTSARRAITKDWAALFPGLAEYKPLHLLRRVGPIVQGIVLEGTSGNDVYRPTFHVHCLLRRSPAVTLGLAHRLVSKRSGGPDEVPIRHHASSYVEAARSLEQQSPLAFAGDLVVRDVLATYRRFVTRPGLHYDADVLFEDIAKILSWCGNVEEAVAALDEGFRGLGGWPTEILDQIGGRETWRSKLLGELAREKLDQVLADEIVTLGLEAIPSSNLVNVL